MAKQIIEVAHVFNGVVENRRYEADRSAVTATAGDVLSIKLRGGTDDEGRPVSDVMLTPNHIVTRRPADSGLS